MKGGSRGPSFSSVGSTSSNETFWEIWEGTNFQDWLYHRGPPIFWLSGYPGSGKTTLMRTFNDSIPEWKECLATCYFSFDSSVNQGDLLLDLLKCLCNRMGQQNIQPLQRPSESPIRPKTFQCELRRLLAELVISHPTVLIVLDGLDEIDQSGTGLLKELERANGAGNALRCLISSRSPPSAAFSNSRLVAHTNIADCPRHPQDIFSLALGRLPLSPVKDDQLQVCRQSLAETVSSKSKGSFLWIEMVLDMLSGNLDSQTWYSTIEIFPSDLHEVLDRKMEAIAAPNKDMIYDIVSCLLAAYRGLSIEELCNILSLNRKSGQSGNASDEIDTLGIETTVRQTCHHLITVTTEQIFQLRHPVVREFLMATQRCDRPTILRGHQFIAVACMRTAISLEEKFAARATHVCHTTLTTMPLLTSAGTISPQASSDFVSDISNPCAFSLQNIAAKSYWQRYVADHWKAHYVQAEPYSKMLTGLLQQALVIHCNHTTEQKSIGVLRPIPIGQHILAFSVSQGLKTLEQLYLSMGYGSSTKCAAFVPSLSRFTVAEDGMDTISLTLRYTVVQDEEESAE